jgi:ribokinase
MGAEVVVIGSINMDMVVVLDHRPAKGETVLGKNFFTSPGGKGANQAYAAGKLGARTMMLGKLGEDAFAPQLIANLQQAGIDTSMITQLPNVSSGIALISIDAEGDNSIIVAPGANSAIAGSDIDRWEPYIQTAKIILLQLEIPLDSVVYAAETAHKHGVPVLLDPAPAQPLPDELLSIVDFITPNESELSAITGVDVTDAESAIKAASRLIDRGGKTVLAKLGSKGVAVVDSKGAFVIDGYAVKAVDTTAAGDSFAGAFAAAFAEGKDVRAAAQFANAVAAIAVTRMGAQASMPSRQEVESFMHQSDQPGSK